MKMAKRVQVLVSLLMVALLFAGCGAPKSDVGTDKAITGLTDTMGRVVHPGKAERIACLWSFAGQVVVMLDKADHVVAVVDGLKRDQMLKQLAPSFAEAETPMLNSIINIESLLKANPDVIFIGTDVYKNKNETEKLNGTGIPYVVTGYTSIAEQQKVIELIGEMVGNKDKALKYNRYYQDCIDLVQQRIADIPPDARQRVYHSVLEPLRTDPSPSLPNDWLKAAGAFNVSAQTDISRNGEFVSLEQIIAWNPQIIIVNEDGVADTIAANPQWRAIDAVKNGKVWQMPVGISRWGHPGSLETPLAILWTAKMLYPDRFADLDMHAETKRFYREFFSMEISDELVEKILRGKGMIDRKSKK